MTRDQAERIRRLHLQSQALLDQTEEAARSRQPLFERLAAQGPDGSRRDRELAKAAAEYLCAWLDAVAAQRAVEIAEHAAADAANCESNEEPQRSNRDGRRAS